MPVFGDIKIENGTELYYVPKFNVGDTVSCTIVPSRIPELEMYDERMTVVKTGILTLTLRTPHNYQGHFLHGYTITKVKERIVDPIDGIFDRIYEFECSRDKCYKETEPGKWEHPFGWYSAKELTSKAPSRPLSSPRPRPVTLSQRPRSRSRGGTKSKCRRNRTYRRQKKNKQQSLI